MARIEVDAGNVQWPAQCCRCGSADYTIRPHSEKVVIWTTLSVTRYRQMTINVPICDRCARAQYLWFGAAAVVGGTIFLPLGLWSTTPDALAVVAVVAVALAIVGTRKRPLKIVKWDEKTNRLTLDIANKGVAAALANR